MSGNDQGWTRAEWARWFIEHDEIDEAARVLSPGDELVLGQSDSLALAAALSRRGLSASYAGRTVRVTELTLAETPRKGPARTNPAATAGAKKTA